MRSCCLRRLASARGRRHEEFVRQCEVSVSQRRSIRPISPVTAAALRRRRSGSAFRSHRSGREREGTGLARVISRLERHRSLLATMRPSLPTYGSPEEPEERGNGMISKSWRGRLAPVVGIFALTGLAFGAATAAGDDGGDPQPVDFTHNVTRRPGAGHKRGVRQRLRRQAGTPSARRRRSQPRTSTPTARRPPARTTRRRSRSTRPTRTT